MGEFKGDTNLVVKLHGNREVMSCTAEGCATTEQDHQHRFQQSFAVHSSQSLIAHFMLQFSVTILHLPRFKVLTFATFLKVNNAAVISQPIAQKPSLSCTIANCTSKHRLFVDWQANFPLVKHSRFFFDCSEEY